MRRTLVSSTGITLITGLLLTAMPAYARWVTLTPSTNGDNNAAMQVISADRDLTRVVFVIPGIEQNDLTIEQLPYSQLVIPGTTVTTAKGEPELPQLGRNVMIPAGSTPIMKIISEDTVEWNVNAPAPSKGSLTRNTDPASIPYSFGKSYHQGAAFPATTITMGKPFRLRDATGVNLVFHPIRYDGRTGKTTVTRRLVVDIVTKGIWTNWGKTTGIMTHNGTIDSTFLDVYKKTFANFSPIVSMNEREVSPEHFIRTNGGVFFVTTDKFRDGIAPLIAWKKQKGYDVDVGVVPAGSKYEDIQSAIQKEYDEHKNAYVILVGDADTIPSHPGKSGNALGNEADPLYGLVAGDDSWPDIVIARFSVKDTTQLATMVNRSLRYDQEPGAGDWYAKAVGIASSEGDPSDGQRMDIIRDILKGWHYTDVDQIYDPSASKEAVIAAVNDGRGFINYIGHGSEDSWVTTDFNSADADALKNSGKWPVIVSVACVNGDFGDTESFAEHWTRAGTPDDPRGAIAMFASSTNQAWIEPTVGQQEIARMLTARKTTTVGGLFLNGSIAVLEAAMDASAQTFETWHIFGDPTVDVRTEVPQAINASMPAFIVGLPSYVISVGESNIQAGVIQNGDVIATGISSSDGRIEMTVRHQPTLGAATLTLTGPDKTPLIRTIQIIAADLPVLVPSSLTANNHMDGKVFVGERLVIGGALKNLGKQAALGATIRLESVQGPAQIVSAESSLGDVAPDATVNLTAGALTVDVLPDAQSNALIVIRIGWTVPNGQSGNDELVLRVQRASLNVTTLGLGQQVNGYFEGISPGESGPMTMTVTNNGTETLVKGSLQGLSATECVDSIDGTVVLESLAPGASATINGLTVHMSSQCQSGQIGTVRFEGKYQGAASQPDIRVLATFKTGRVRTIVADYQNIALPIEDGAATPTNFGVTLEQQGTVLDLQIKVDITHTWIGDLEIELVHPDGTSVFLHKTTGGGTHDLHFVYGKDGTKLDALDVFKGKPAGGTWKLRLRDVTKPDSGTLDNVRLTVWSY